MHKISLSDLARVNLRETQEQLDVSKGDLVCLHPEHGNKQKVVGIVTKVYYDKMLLMINNNRLEWWSRFVKGNILS